MAGRGFSLARTSDRRESGRGVLDIRPDGRALWRSSATSSSPPPSRQPNARPASNTTARRAPYLQGLGDLRRACP
jgi:hypothetical protein